MRTQIIDNTQHYYLVKRNNHDKLSRDFLSKIIDKREMIVVNLARPYLHRDEIAPAH